MRDLRADSQNTAILTALQSGQVLTQGLALAEIGCGRLASRVNELRKRGYTEIQSRIVKLESGARVAEYFIPR